MLLPATGAHSLLDPGNALGAVFYGAIILHSPRVVPTQMGKALDDLMPPRP